jgi:hypothetical protein
MGYLRAVSMPILYSVGCLMNWKGCGRKVKIKLRGLVRERTIPTERPPLVGEVMPIFADRGCRLVSATVSHGR